MDHFILARLAQNDLEPSPPADARTLVRRLYYDLIGLPPSLAEIDAFAADPSNAAYEQLVDRLLASEHFGERWARHWLDIARFGDTKGYVFTEDRNYPHAYKYRDWVIDAFNRDLPFDEFLKYQIAGDLLLAEGQREQLAALGFLTLGRRFLNNQHDLIDDRIDVVFRGTMGLTVGCARCHDHKYDPLSIQDYYGLYGVFASSQEQQGDDLPLRLIDRANPADVRVFLRGSPGNPGEVAVRRFPAFFAGPAEPFRDGSGRRQLAEAIAHESNPLTARVFVNRVWGHLFGDALVPTQSDFGLQSDRPVQQDVLDHLAIEFMQNGWSTKRLIRGIVLSRTYRQQSHLRGDAQERDPENQLLWRMNRKRLDFEAMRDSLLVAAGQLDGTIKGPSVQIANETPSKRRTLYAFIDRQNLPGLFRTFDFASPDTHTPARPRTTVPQQALYLMNNAFVQNLADTLGEGLTSETNHAERVAELYRAILARSPSQEELDLAVRFVQSAPNTEPQHAPVWRFGYGTIRGEGQSATVEFKEFPHFTGAAWQGGPKLPAADLGWAMLHGRGGHAGNDADHAVVRRWIAPRDGVVAISGALNHPAKHGDGVRGSIVASGGVVGQWIAKSQAVATSAESVSVQRGEPLDFVTDCRDNVNHDSFEWLATIRFRDSSEQYQSESGFRGPAAQPMDAWAQLAQTLLWTNEFMFVD